MPRSKRKRASPSRTPGPAERRGRDWSSASLRLRYLHSADQLAEWRRLERRQPEVGFAQVEVGCQWIGHGDAEELRGLRRPDPIGRVLERNGLARRYRKTLKRHAVELWIGLGPGHVLTTHNGIKVLMDAETLEMLHHPGRARAGSDGHLQAEPARVGQVLLDARQQLLHRRGLFVVQALQVIELLAVELLAG